MRPIALMALMSVVAASVGCGGGSAETRPSQTAATTTTSARSVDVSRSPTPDSDAGRQLTWVVNSLKHPPTDAEAKQHFTPDFLAHIDAGKVVALFRQIDASSTTERFVLDSVETGQTPRELVGIVSGKEGRLHVGVVVDPDGSGRMSALLIKQAD